MTKDLSLDILAKDEDQIFKATSTNYNFGLHEDKVSALLKDISERLSIEGGILIQKVEQTTRHGDREWTKKVLTIEYAEKITEEEVTEEEVTEDEVTEEEVTEEEVTEDEVTEEEVTEDEVTEDE